MSEHVDLIRRLAATTGWVTGALSHLGDRASERPSDEEWSAIEIVEHLIASDAIISPRVFQIILREDAPLPAFDERKMAGLIRRSNLPTELHLELLAKGRQRLIAFLETLTDSEWNATGVHEERGRISILQLVSHLVEHEEEHRTQLEKMVPTS